MLQAYVHNNETDESIGVDLPPDFLEHIFKNSRIIGTVGIDLRDNVTGIMEYHLISREDIEPIH